MNIGGGASKGTTTVEFAQRVLAIPPQISVEIMSFPIWDYETNKSLVTSASSWTYSFYCIKLTSNKAKWKQGTAVNYAPESNVRASFWITYGFDENFEGPTHIMKSSMGLLRATSIGTKPIEDIFSKYNQCYFYYKLTK